LCALPLKKSVRRLSVQCGADEFTGADKDTGVLDHHIMTADETSVAYGGNPRNFAFETPIAPGILLVRQSRDIRWALCRIVC